MQASTDFDELLHCVEWIGSDIKILLEKSHGYSWPVTERCSTYSKCSSTWRHVSCLFRPPVMGEGSSDSYLLLRTDSVNITFSQDSPGDCRV